MTSTTRGPVLRSSYVVGPFLSSGFPAYRVSEPDDSNVHAGPSSDVPSPGAPSPEVVASMDAPAAPPHAASATSNPIQALITPGSNRVGADARATVRRAARVARTPVQPTRNRNLAFLRSGRRHHPAWHQRPRRHLPRR